MSIFSFECLKIKKTSIDYVAVLTDWPKRTLKKIHSFLSAPM